MLTLAFWFVVAVYLAVALHWYRQDRWNTAMHQRKAIEMETLP